MSNQQEGGAVAEAAALPPLPETEACPWPVAYTDCAGGCSFDEWDDPQAAQAWFEAQATELLWEWTGRIYGVCEVAVRPCKSDCGGPSPSSTFWGRGPGYDPGFPRQGAWNGSGWNPVLIGGQWHNMSCGCTGTCSCETEGARALRLPGPVGEVSEVMLDGEVLDPSKYRVMYHSLLVRTDGQTWPACQNLLALPTEPDTFEVTYSKGIPVPIGGQVAAGRLACELAKGACGGDDCALPERLQSVTRQGISVGIALTDQSWEQTGIWSIDNWVSSVNKPRPFASVRSVDLPARRY